MTAGFSVSPWGVSWGSGGGTLADETIPYTERWDTFDLSGVRQPDDMDRVQSFTEVSTAGDGGAFFPGSLNIASGGVYVADTAVLLIDKAVTENFTVQYDVTFHSLPASFADVASEHVYLGAWSSQDFAAGFFMSQDGIAYTGEVSLVGGAIVPGQDVQVLAGSSTWIQEGIEYVIRAAVNAETQLLYLFVTPAALIANGASPILRAILPARPTATLVSDNIWVSVKGTVPAPSWIELFSYQMCSRFQVDNLAPIAVAGTDQASRLCSIIQLDGSSSYDPEGVTLTYEWRLTDAPMGSVYTVECSDGVSSPSIPPTGFSCRLFSESLGDANVAEPIAVGDVVTIGDLSLTVVGKGIFGGDFYVDVEYEQLPDDYVAASFKLLRQAGVSDPTTVGPTFYPDVVGFYTFDLRVTDGMLSSSPLGTDRSKVLLNVVSSALPRGCGVDASFMLDYMLSFWRLVEDKTLIITYYESISRVAATELFTLWQTEYSKSLRDIQRTFVRRWLHYDLLLPEPVPELSRVKMLWSGARSMSVTGAVSGVAGSKLVVISPRLTGPVEVLLRSPGSVDPERYAQDIKAQLNQSFGPVFNTFVEYERASVSSTTNVSQLLFPASVAGLTLSVTVGTGAAESVTVGLPATEAEFIAELSAGLPSVSVSSFIGELRLGAKVAGAGQNIVVDASSTLLTVVALDALECSYGWSILVAANAPFTFTSASTAPGFSYPLVNTLVGGIRGYKVGDRTFKVSSSLASQGITEDDLLVVGREAYRVGRVVDDVRDDLRFQRVVVKEILPTSLDAPDSYSPPPLVDWIVPGWVQSELLNFYGGLVDRGDHVDFEVATDYADGERGLDLVETVAIGACAGKPNRLGVDTAQLSSLLTGSETAVRLARIVRRHYVPIDSRITDVPTVGEYIQVADAEAVLRRNVDFFIEDFRGQHCLRFCSGVGTELGDVWEAGRPPNRLWAEYTFIDNEDVIEANFGVPVGLTRDKVPDNVDYLSAVRGIWYALYNGPTVRNLRIALQIFLGLPFAEVAGVIREVRTDFLSQQSRILIQDADNPEIVRSYTYPRVLDLEVNPATGLHYVAGDTVDEFAPLVSGADVVDWVKDPKWFEGIVNQGIFVEPQKYHTFMVRVAYEAFNLNSLLFAQDFVRDVKPAYTDPLYVVTFGVAGDGEEIDVIDDVSYDVTLHLQDSMCGDRMGASTSFDEPWPAGAEADRLWRNAFDTGDDPAILPTPPVADVVNWGYDKGYFCPDDEVDLQVCSDYVGELPRFDSVFSYDVGQSEQLASITAGPVPFPLSIPLGVAVSAGTLDRVFLQLSGATGVITEAYWEVAVLVDGVEEATIPFVLGRTEYQMPGPTLVFVTTIPYNVEVTGTVGVSVTAGQAIALIVRPTSLAAQTPSWLSVYAAVNVEAAAWQFDVPVTGTICSFAELSVAV